MYPLETSATESDNPGCPKNEVVGVEKFFLGGRMANPELHVLSMFYNTIGSCLVMFFEAAYFEGQ